jgi:aminoglycoside phosphotransferase (APT) family kinase protein
VKSALSDLHGLQRRFVQLVESAPNLPERERRAALQRLRGSTGYEWMLLSRPDAGHPALIAPGDWSMAPLFGLTLFREVVVWDTNPRRAELLDVLSREGDSRLRVIDPEAESLAEHLGTGAERYALVAFEGDSRLRSLHGAAGRRLFDRVAGALAPDGQCAIVGESRLTRGAVKRLLLEGEGSGAFGLRRLRRALDRSSLPPRRTIRLSPDHRDPREIADWREGGPRRHCAFAVLSGNGRSTSLVEQVVTSVRSALGAGAVGEVGRYTVRDTATVMLMVGLDSSREAVVRIPLDHTADGRLQHAWSAIESLRDRAPCVASLVPEPLVRGDVGGIPFYAERRYEGVIAKSLLRDATYRPALMKAVLDFSLQLNAAVLEHKRVDDRVLEEHFATDFASIRRYVPGSAPRLEKLRSYVFNRMRGVMLPLVWIHGDLHASNILCDPGTGEIRVVIDWDSSGARGLPLLDLLHFLVSDARQPKGLCMGAGVASAFDGTLLTDAANDLIDRYLQAMELPRDSVRPLLIMYWVRQVALRIARSDGELANRWETSNLSEPLDRIDVP